MRVRWRERKQQLQQGQKQQLFG